MRHWLGALSRFIAIYLFLAAVTPLGAARAAQARQVLRIRIPREIDPGRLTLLSGVYWRGLSIGQQQTKSGVREYQIALPESASVKLLLYCPGYRIVAATLSAKEISASPLFEPRFEKVPMVPLTVGLVSTRGEPLMGEKVSLEQGLFEMEYFGYGDGRVFPTTVATATTDAHGEASVEVPSSLDDPYFAKYEGGKHIRLGFSLSLPQKPPEHYGCDFEPRLIPAQRSYPEPVAITIVYRGQISGRVEKSFLRRYNVPARVLRAVGRGRHKPLPLALTAYRKGGGSGTDLRPDGSFSMILPAGTYDLAIQVRTNTGRFLRSLPIQTGFILRENEHQIVNLK